MMIETKRKRKRWIAGGRSGRKEPINNEKKKEEEREREEEKAMKK